MRRPWVSCLPSSHSRSAPPIFPNTSPNTLKNSFHSPPFHLLLQLTGETFDVELLNPLQSLALVIGILAGGVWLSLSEKAGENKSE